MAQITKPSDLSLIWASAGDILNPGDTKYQTGWQVEIPPRQWENYIQNKQDQAIAHFNQHGIPVWDTTTEYQANKSYVQGSTSGTIYQCILTHTNQDPEADLTNTYWIVAFAAAGTFYTKSEADSKFLDADSNLSDLTNPVDARTALSVYSKTETYTKTEVDNKTTIASTPQAQAQTSNATLLTPLRLFEAFKGSNQLLAASGFQKIPGGYVLQHGFADVAATSGTINFPTPFPNACFGVFITDLTTSAATIVTYGTNVPTTTSFTWYASNTAGGFSWFAVGY